MKNLADINTAQEWKNAYQNINTLLGLVDIVHQRLQAKVIEIGEDNLGMDERFELEACKKLRKNILN